MQWVMGLRYCLTGVERRSRENLLGQRDEAQGTGHYTQSAPSGTLNDAVLGPTQIGDKSAREHGLGLVTYNTDGLDYHGLHKLLCWLQLGLAGGMYLTDVRCTGREKDRWTASVKAALGPHAKLYMAPIKPLARNGKCEERARVGGSMIILNNYWGIRAYDWFQDESELGLVMGVYLKLPSTKALWMGTYWPVQAPDSDWSELPTSGRLAHRTSAFLVSRGYGTTTPLEYVQGVISHFAALHRTRFPGSPVIVSGDFNKPACRLNEWATVDSWTMPLESILPAETEFNTYWATAAHKRGPDYEGTSRIDHFLVKNGGGHGSACLHAILGVVLGGYVGPSPSAMLGLWTSLHPT